MTNRSPTAFGALLKRHRTAALLTQEQLALRAHLSPDTIRALESGKRRTPRPDSLHLLVEALALPDAERAVFLAAAAPPAIVSDTDGPFRIPADASLGSAQPSLLIGRDGELETIRQRLAGVGDADVERARLFTLTGPAGVGKTRLALAAAARIADRFADGVVLADLTPIREPALVLPTVARALNLDDISNRPLLERLCDYLRERRVLLVLDNFEQVLPAAGTLADLLTNCTGLVLLVTSRVPLRLRWEWTLRVSPLPVPDVAAPLPPLDALRRIPAVALFLERARRADFALTEVNAPLVAQLTSELDGLPLALELAAARLDVLPLPALARRLGDRLRLLRWEAADLPERQRSLEAAVGWSYDFLGAPERRVFRCLGVFAGHVALRPMAAVLAATSAGTDDTDEISEMSEGRILDVLASLAEKSLVLPSGQDEHGMLDDEEDTVAPDFTMLETVREYAWEQLERLGALEGARRAHAYAFLALAERADPHLRGRDQLAWYFRLEREHNNLRAALRWLLTREGDGAATDHQAGLRLAAALAWFWWTRGYIVEGANWLAEALARAPNADPTLRARALRGAGVMLAYQGAFDRAKAALGQALAPAPRTQDAGTAQALSYLGLCAVYAGDAATGVPLLREALRRGRTLGDPHPVAMTLLFLGAATFSQGEHAQSARYYTESLAAFEAAEDGLFAANTRLNLGWFAWRRGDLQTAITHIRTGLEMGRLSENRRLLSFGAQTALSVLSDADASEPGRMPDDGDLAARAQLLGAIDALSQATGMTLLQTVVKDSMADLRERVRRAGLEAEYRAGRSLPFRATTDLALAQLARIPETTPVREPVSANVHERQGALSLRQREVLRLVAQGLSNKEIARQLFVSASTVNYHLTSAFNKLGVGTRAQAIAVAAQHDLL